MHLAERVVIPLLSVPESQYYKSGAIVLTWLCKGGTIGKAENNSSNYGLKFSAVASESFKENDGRAKGHRPGLDVRTVSKRDGKQDKARKQQRAWAREEAKRQAWSAQEAAKPKPEVVITKSHASPTHETHAHGASAELIEQFDKALAALGEPSDRYFASRKSLLKSGSGAFRGMDDYKAELGALVHEWLWKMRHAEEPIVIRSNHGTAVGYTFNIKTERGSYSTDFGLYVEPDGSIEVIPESLAVCMSWNHKFMAAYELEARVRKAHMSMAMRLLDAYGLRLTA